MVAILDLCHVRERTRHFEVHPKSPASPQFAFEAVVVADPDLHTWTEGGFGLYWPLGGIVSR